MLTWLSRIKTVYLGGAIFLGVTKFQPMRCKHKWSVKLLGTILTEKSMYILQQFLLYVGWNTDDCWTQAAHLRPWGWSHVLRMIEHILSRVKQITSPGWMHETSARTWCTGKTQRDRVKREVGGGIGMGNTCRSMADSCQCMTKTTTILWSNYPPTSKK